MLAWASTSHRGQVASVAPSPRQCHRQHDSAETSHHDQHRLGGTIANTTQQLHHATKKSPQQLCRQHDSGDMAHTSPTSNLIQRIIADQAWGLEEYFSKSPLMSPRGGGEYAILKFNKTYSGIRTVKTGQSGLANQTV
jgi:hypothetical protein